MDEYWSQRALEEATAQLQAAVQLELEPLVRGQLEHGPGWPDHPMHPGRTPRSHSLSAWHEGELTTKVGSRKRQTIPFGVTHPEMSIGTKVEVTHRRWLRLHTCHLLSQQLEVQQTVKHANAPPATQKCTYVLDAAHT
jgi:hypothetical protein